MMEFRATDLCFSPEECAQFLNEAMMLGLNCRGEPVGAAHGGMGTGLQMVSLALQAQPDQSPEERRAFVTSFAGDDHYIGDYLVEQVSSGSRIDSDVFTANFALRAPVWPVMYAIIWVEPAGLPDVDGQVTLSRLYMPICSIFPWITARNGIAIITCLPICYAAVYARCQFGADC